MYSLCIQVLFIVLYCRLVRCVLWTNYGGCLSLYFFFVATFIIDYFYFYYIIYLFINFKSASDREGRRCNYRRYYWGSLFRPASS